MNASGSDPSTRRRRALFASFALSAPGPIVTGIAAATSLSATQIADFIRRSAELAALFVAWYVFRKLNKGDGESAARGAWIRAPRTRDVSIRAPEARARLELAANRTVAAAMMCSGAAMATVGVMRLAAYDAKGDVTLGLVIAVLGLIFNSAFWWRYRSFTRQQFDPVVAGQQRLYRAKTLVDICVVGALATVAFAPSHPATPFVDAFGSIAVAAYLLHQGAYTARRGLARPQSAA